MNKKIFSVLLLVVSYNQFCCTMQKVKSEVTEKNLNNNKEGWQRIKLWKDAIPFAGKIIACNSYSKVDHTRVYASKWDNAGYKLDVNSYITYGYISKDIEYLPGDFILNDLGKSNATITYGYYLSKFFSNKESLVESSLFFSNSNKEPHTESSLLISDLKGRKYLKLRLVTPEELKKIGEAIISNEVVLGDFEKNKTLQILKENEELKENKK